MRRLAILFLAATAGALAQLPPRAAPVDPALQANAGEDWFQHGRNTYESAKRSTGTVQFDLFHRSIEIFNRYLNEFPNHANAEAAWWYLGQSYYSIGRVEDAKRCFHSLLNRFGRGKYAAAAAYTLAADHFNNRNYALAATLFDKLATIATKPTDRHRGLYYAGKSMEMQKRSRSAIRYYRRLIEEPQGNLYLAKGMVALGGLLSEEGDFKEAVEYLDRVVNSSASVETRGEAALKAGAAAAKLGDSDTSDQYLNLVMRTPGMEAYRPDAQVTLMTSRYEEGRYRDVVNIFARSSERSEGEREARRLMVAARSFMMLNRNADALPLFREIERMVLADGRYAFDAAYYRLLCFYRIEGRYLLDQINGFLELYGKKYPRDPKVHTARLMKAETLYAEKKYPEAAEIYRDIDTGRLSKKNQRGLLYQRGRCLADAGDPASAIDSLSEFINTFPDDERVPIALATRGRAYGETGQTGPAMADFDKLIATSTDPELLALAYLEGAHIAKQRNDLDAMVQRYLMFLEKVPSASRGSLAKASYWAGWGMVKTERGTEAVPHLVKARDLDGKLYGKHAGLLLCLVHYADQKPGEVFGELDLAISGGYHPDLPDQLIRWAADQAFNGDDFSRAARYYNLIADSANPQLSPRDVWRFLGKSRIEAGDPEGALTALDHALAEELDPAWQADGKLDRGRALFDLERFDEAMKEVDEGLELRPQGRVAAGLHMLRGDLQMQQGRADEAVRSYILPVELMDDDDQVVKPLALHKLVTALNKAGKPQDAAKYQAQLDASYPAWTPGE